MESSWWHQTSLNTFDYQTSKTTASSRPSHAVLAANWCSPSGHSETDLWGQKMYQNQGFVSKKAWHTKCQTQGLSLKLCRILLVALANSNHSHIKSSSDDFQDQTDGLQQRSCCGKTIQCAGQSPPFDKKTEKKTKCVSYQHKKCCLHLTPHRRKKKTWRLLVIATYL